MFVFVYNIINVKPYLGKIKIKKKQYLFEKPLQIRKQHVS